MATQDAMLTRRMGGALEPRTFAAQLFELSEYATLLDDRYAKNQRRRHASTTNTSRADNGNPDDDFADNNAN